MKYKYLHAWSKRIQLKDKEVKKITRFQDQYLITFFKENEGLQISLNQGNSFMFVTDNDYLPFEEDKHLNIFEQNLKKSRLVQVSIMDNDRIYMLEFIKKDIYNEVKKYVLILEFAAGFENIILTEKQGNELIIKEALKKFSFAENNQRQILAKMEWKAPITDFKADKSDVDLSLSIDDKGRINEDKDSEYSDVNVLFETLYYDYILKKKGLDIQKSLVKQAKNTLKKSKKKLLKQHSELESATSVDKWFHYAELLKSNIHLVKKGMTSVKLVNYFDDSFPEIEIPIQEEKNIQQNINHYYKKYKKAKSGIEIIKKQIAKTMEEIAKIESKINGIEGESDYLELQKMQKNRDSQKQSMDDKVLFRRIKIDDDWEIYIGRSSKENDILTCRVAKNRDWWFHTRIFQGTHVVLRNYSNKQLPDKYRIICSQLAAYYSKAKKSENVPVDYTQIRYVRKPRGAVAGYVTYTNQKTIYVNPMDYRQASEKINKINGN